MNRISFFLLFWLYSAIVYSQSARIDSIESILEQDDNPISQIDYHLGLTRLHMLGEGNIDDGLEHANSALEIARSINSKKYEALATAFKGALHYNLSKPYKEIQANAKALAIQSGDPDAIAFTTYNWVETCIYDPAEGIKLLEDILNKYSLAISDKNLGNVYKAIAWEYEKNGEFYKAEQAYLQSIEIFKLISQEPQIDPELGRISSQLVDGGKGNLMQSTLYLGQLYSSQGRHKEAIQYGLQAFESQSTDSDIAYLSGNLADIYRTAGKIDDAITNYNQSIQLYRNLNEPTFLARTLQGLGHTYLMMNEYQEAEKRYLEAYEFEKDVPNTAAEALITLARLYKQTNRLELSIETYIKADSIFASLDNKPARITCQLSIAEAQGEQGLYDLAYDKINSQIPLLEKTQNYPLLFDAYAKLSKIEDQRNNYDNAIQYGIQALDIAKQHQDLSLISSGHKLLSRSNGNAQHFEDAFFHLKQHQIYKDSLFTLNALQKLKEEQVRQNISEHIDEKEEAQEIASLLESQNRRYLIISILLLSLLAIGTYLFVQLRKTRKLLQDQNLQLQELNKTKDRFFGIIAHDIRSPILALESVDEQMQYYAQKGDVSKLQKISGMVGGTARQLNALLDNLLNWALLQTGMIPYRPSILNMRDLTAETLSLFSTNAKIKNVKLENRISPNISTFADPNAVQTILRNIISNALKFSPYDGKIIIETLDKENQAILTIADQGQGMSQAEIEKIFSLDKKSKKGTDGERGTGLGLILVKDLVELNKGTIQINSEIGHGTTVRISLPLKEQKR